MATCDPASLLASAACLSCVSENDLRRMEIVLLCSVVNSVNPSAFLDFDFIADLRAQTVVPGMLYAMVNQETVEGDGSSGGWYWNPTSTDTDDGTSIAKPDSLAVNQPGRWIKHFG